MTFVDVSPHMRPVKRCFGGEATSVGISEHSASMKSELREVGSKLTVNNVRCGNVFEPDCLPDTCCACMSIRGSDSACSLLATGLILTAEFVKYFNCDYVIA